MYIHKIAERDTKELAPGIMGRTFWGEKMLVSVAELEPNTTGKLHSHPHEQVGTLIEGAVTFRIAGEEYHAEPGYVFVIPGGVEHSASTGDAKAVIMEVFSPVREEFKY